MKHEQDKATTAADLANHGSSVGSSRRKVLAMMGTAAVAIPVVGLTGCGGGESGADAGSSAPAADMPAMKAEADKLAGMVEKSVEESAEEMAADAEAMAEDMADDMTAKADAIATDAMARVDENSAQAKGLGYRHDGSTVDAASQPRYAAGQQCSNCALYQGGAAEWGGCPLFAAQQVKGTGWCNAYAPAA